MKKNYNYNNLVRFYNRSLKKLNSLVLQGKNLYKQDILNRRIARLFELLTGMQTKMKLSTATAALAAGFVLFQPNAASAQTFPVQLTNPFNLAAVPTATAWATPSFVDLDNDGDKDVMAGDKNGDFFYYRNIGTASVPNFSASVMNPYSITGMTSTYSSPVFVDINNDGDLDMFSGNDAGDMIYYQNTGTVSAPVFAAPVANPFGITTIAAGYSAGSFVDLNNDGDKDLIVGDYNGDFHYYQNTGTASAPAFAAPTMNPFGLAQTTGGYATATFVDIDKDGDRDMFSGNGGGFDYFENTGTVTAPAFAAVVNNPFLLIDIPASSNGASLSFADLDNDLDMDLISGSATGNLIYYNNASPTGIAKNHLIDGLSVYPNPTSNNITLKLNNTSEVLTVEVTNAIGQVVNTMEISNSTNTVVLPEAKGMYFVKVTNASNKSNVFKIVKN